MKILNSCFICTEGAHMLEKEDHRCDRGREMLGTCRSQRCDTNRAKSFPQYLRPLADGQEG